MYKHLTKSNIKNALTALTALLNLIILAFPTVSATHKTLSQGTERYFANGFTLAFSECPPVCDEIKNWLSFYNLAHFIIGVCIIAALAAVVIIKKRFEFGGIGFASVMISLALSVFYMVNGIIANNLASDYASLYYECHTLAPLGFALVAASALGLLLSHLFLADDTN